MGKDKKEKSAKKEKKEAKLSTDKVSKKDKKEKKEKKTKEVVERLYEELTGKKEEEPKNVDESESEGEEMAVDAAGPTGGLELLPFAKPLMDEKLEKKALKAVKKGAKARVLRRGVKEVVKYLRKLPTTPAASTKEAPLPQGFVILAADISPMDVISHLPVLCEDHSVPYVFVKSRAELGRVAGTKRLTSAIAVVPSAGGKGKQEDKDEFTDAYKKVAGEIVELSRSMKM